MTSAHWRSYAAAIITFLVGGSNQLFGTHFQPDVVYVALVLCVSLIAAEFHFIRTKEWNNAESQFLKIYPQLKSLFSEIIKEFGKGFGNTVTSSVVSTSIAPAIPTSDSQTPNSQTPKAEETTNNQSKS